MVITDKLPAGMATKIQSKAYRANTQSQQVDGLYKPQKFVTRPALLNHTRTPYNIMNPNQAQDLEKVPQILKDIAPSMHP